MSIHTPMRRSGAITLGDLAGRLETLRVACSKCSRSGSYSVARLIDRYGADAGLPDFKDRITSDCPVRVKPTWEPCNACFPDLSTVF